MNRLILKRSFTLANPSEWKCPTCGNGILKIKKDAFKSGEIALSRDHSLEAWELEWVSYAFSCVLICNNSQCEEYVSCTGTGSADVEHFENEDGSVDSEYIESYLPKYFEPHLRPIDIPDGCPKSVSKPLEESFKLFFCSPGASLNCVRMATEELLSYLKVPRCHVANNKMTFISLHRRIDLLPEKYSELKDLILAVKWLGNAGSHSNGDVTIDDVMDSYEMIEHVLQEIYVPKTKKLSALAKQVNKKRGPLKRKKHPFA